MRKTSKDNSIKVCDNNFSRKLFVCFIKEEKLPCFPVNTQNNTARDLIRLNCTVSGHKL